MGQQASATDWPHCNIQVACQMPLKKMSVYFSALGEQLKARGPPPCEISSTQLKI
jgi:hypothetical protein